VDIGDLSLSEKIKPIIKGAGEIVCLYFQKTFSSEKKKDGSIVTQADLASEQFLTEKLQLLFPEAGIIGEEKGNNGLKSDYFWVIDPLDGTTNFSRGLPYFCVSVALTYKGNSVFGAIYNPLTDECFWAQKGKGAFLNGLKIRVSSISSLKKGVVAVGLPYRQGVPFKGIFEKMGVLAFKSFAFRHFGAIALDLAYVAAGRLDAVCFEGLGWWDVAAGMLLIEEAGGIVTDFKGNQIKEGYTSFLAAGKELYDPLRNLLEMNKS